ncbi:MAG: hypothetical protein KTR31_26780 [Myxococcales bacterium]|nr:hypothetical protein [Myxococcales bacterium]
MWLLLITSAGAADDVCVVPGAHPDVASAVDDPGCTTIRLRAGLHRASVQLTGRTLRFEGAPGAVWQPADQPRILHLRQESSVEIDGILFDGDQRGRALQIDGKSSATIRRCRFQDTTSPFSGGTIHGFDIGDLVISDSHFDTSTSELGGHIQVTDARSVVLERTAFLRGQSSEDAGAVHLNRAPATLVDLWFEGNTASDQAGALQLLATPATEVRSSLFCDNRATNDGGAVVVRGSESQVSLVGNLFLANASGLQAGAIASQQGVLSSTNNHFVGNTSEHQGSAIWTNTAGQHRNALIAHNVSALAVGAAFYHQTQGQLLDHTLLFGNAPSGSNVDVDDAVLGDPGLPAGPLFACEPLSYLPPHGSPAIDAGHPDVLDVDDSPSDLGAFGGPRPFGLDVDDDGVHSALDCDDQDASVHPGALEACNGTDDDCDGTLPPDELDADGDGYALCAGDCDDDDATVSPVAAEVPCNDIDDDCSPTTEDCPGEPPSQPRPEPDDGTVDGCACSTSSPAPAPLLLALLLIGRRRSPHCGTAVSTSSEIP